MGGAAEEEGEKWMSMGRAIKGWVKNHVSSHFREREREDNKQNGGGCWSREIHKFHLLCSRFTGPSY